MRRVGGRASRERPARFWAVEQPSAARVLMRTAGAPWEGGSGGDPGKLGPGGRALLGAGPGSSPARLGAGRAQAERGAGMAQRCAAGLPAPLLGAVSGFEAAEGGFL